MKLAATLLVAAALVVGFVGLRSAAVKAQAEQAAGSVDAAADEFWQRWETTRPSLAIMQAAPTPQYQRAWEGLGQAADDFQNRSGGKCLGHSPLVRKPLGDRMQYVSFLALYDPVPMRVQMLYYRAKDKWSAISLKVDAAPSRWLAEANPVQVVTAPAEQGGNDDLLGNGGQ